MKKLFAKALVILVAILASSSMVYAKDEGSVLEAHLRGFQEVPVVSTVATGEFRGVIDPTNSSILFDLSYTGIQGTVTQAHIHVGQRSVNGGIVIWFCQTDASPGPAGTPTCTNGSGHFTGTITSANVVAITGANAPQQIGAGDFDKVLEAIRAGKAYANVHSTLSPGGEIRGQIKVITRHDDRRDDDHKRKDDKH
jgi:CHRD domain